MRLDVKGQIIALAVLLNACGFDNRSQTIVVDDPDLRGAVQQSIDFWNEAAPGQLDLQVADTCDLNCTFVQWGELPKKKEGQCQRRFTVQTLGNKEQTAIITIDAELEAEKLRGTMIHEFGHSFGLDHVGDEKDLMFTFDKPGQCVGEHTEAQWQDLFGEGLKHLCL